MHKMFSLEVELALAATGPGLDVKLALNKALGRKIQALVNSR